MTETEALMPMFDCDRPDDAGGLAGEFLASALERHTRYPVLDPVRDFDLFRKARGHFEICLSNVLNLLPGLGFDGAGVTIYQLAARSAFQAALPIRRHIGDVHVIT